MRPNSEDQGLFHETNLTLRVSVIIPTYNRALYLAEAVRSALMQTYPRKEVIVIDDGSTDNTGEVIRDFKDRVRYIRQPRLGKSQARNHGIRVAQGELIAFLDSDDIWLPSKLESQVRLFSSRKVGLAYTNCYQINEDGFISGRFMSRPLNKSALEELFLSDFIPTSTLVVRRDCITSHHVNGFDEAVPWGEDYLLKVRLLAHFDVARVDKCLACWREHPSSGSRQQAHVSFQYRLVDRICEEFPQLLPLRTSKIALLHWEEGMLNLSIGNAYKARQHFAQSLKLDPRNSSVYALWLMALSGDLLGCRMYTWLKQIRKKQQMEKSYRGLHWSSLS